MHTTPELRTTDDTHAQHNYIVLCICYKQYLCDRNDLIAFEIVYHL